MIWQCLFLIKLAAFCQAMDSFSKCSETNCSIICSTVFPVSTMISNYLFCLFLKEQYFLFSNSLETFLPPWCLTLRIISASSFKFLDVIRFNQFPSFIQCFIDTCSVLRAFLSYPKCEPGQQHLCWTVRLLL